MAKSFSPKGPFTLTPYLSVKGANAAIDFYAKVLGAREQFRLAEPDGRIGHAELAIGDGGIILADEAPAFGALSPPTIGGTPVKLHLYVDDVDGVMKRAVAEGATILRPAQDQFYGDRSGMIADPFGHQWFLSTRKEAVSTEEMQKRYSDSFKAE
ncbi:MAG: VOC family protein [Rhizomicrobium sp.]